MIVVLRRYSQHIVRMCVMGRLEKGIMRKKRSVLLAVLVLLVGVQFVPVNRTNPGGGVEIVAPADVKAVLERSCYDCHSNETKWPWYSHLAPVSWIIAHDVTEGREHLNFSVWGEYAAKDRAHLSEEAVEEVSKGGMPIKAYLFLHRGAKIRPGEVDVLKAWARTEMAAGSDGISH